MPQGKGVGKGKKGKSEGGIKRKLGRTKKGLKKQAKSKKIDQIVSKEVQKKLTKSINQSIETLDRLYLKHKYAAFRLNPLKIAKLCNACL